VAESEQALAEAEPAVAKAESAAAEAKPADSMTQWASLSEEAVTAEPKQQDELQLASAQHVITENCESESAAADPAAADHVVSNDIDKADPAREATVQKQNQEDGTAGILALSEGSLCLQTSPQLK